MESSIRIIGLRTPLIERECDVAGLLLDAFNRQGVVLEDGDVIVLTSKLVSKCLGLLVDLRRIVPSERALSIARRAGGDPRFIELLLRESDDLLFAVPVKELVEEGLVDLYSFSEDRENAMKLLERYPTLFVTLRDNTLWSDSGLDSSNHPKGIISVPPKNPDRIAKEIRDRIMERTGKKTAVIICDTEVFIEGSIDLARGSYGIIPVDRGFGSLDLYGKPKYGGVDAIAHEACAAAALVMRQASQGVPAAIIKGLEYEECECGYRDIIKYRPERIGKIVKKIIAHTRRVLGLKVSLKKIIELFV